MAKQFINEATRMQKLAGIISEAKVNPVSIPTRYSNYNSIPYEIKSLLQQFKHRTGAENYLDNESLKAIYNHFGDKLFDDNFFLKYKFNYDHPLFKQEILNTRKRRQEVFNKMDKVASKSKNQKSRDFQNAYNELKQHLNNISSYERFKISPNELSLNTNEAKVVPANILLPMLTSDSTEESSAIDYNNVAKNIKMFKPLIAKKLQSYSLDKDTLDRFLINYANGYVETEHAGEQYFYHNITLQGWLWDIVTSFKYMYKKDEEMKYEPDPRYDKLTIDDIR